MRNYRAERGAALKEARIKAGLTQTELAEILGYRSGQFTCNWERGLCDPPFEKLPLLARTLRISPGYLIRSITEEIRQALEEQFKKSGKGQRPSTKRL